MGTAPPQAKKRRVADLLGISIEPFEAHKAFKPDEAIVLKSDGSWSAAEAITKQMPNVGIPMTILTGFLGAGKSTVLNYILKADHGLRIAVLINEFGEVDIDNQLVDTQEKGAEGDPIQLNNGCVCCTISNGFIDAVQKILDRPDAPLPHYFILETSGVADPKPIIDSVSNTELNAQMYVDQVLTVIDSSSWTIDHYDSDAAASQLRWADTVLLSKTDLVKEPDLKNVINNLLDIKPNTRVLKSQKGYVPLTALFDIDLTKSRVEDIKKKNDEAAAAAAKQAAEEAAKLNPEGDTKKENGHEHGNDHKKVEEHDHGHTKEHDHDHKKEHDHDHTKEHDHKHDEKKEHDHDHKHEHKHDEKKEHGHDHKHEDKKEHDHEHKHEHKKDGDHKHDHEHKHEHKDGDQDHKHDHKHEHKHEHKDGKKSSCGHNHKPGEKCGHSHKKEKEKQGHLERDGFSSIAFTTDKSFSLFRFKNEFMEDLPEEVFRAKGLLYFKGYDSRFVFHWSGRRFNVEEDDWPEGTKPSNQLVVIGRKMDKKAVMKMLEDCITRPDDPDEDEFGNDPNEVYGDEDDEGAQEGATENGTAYAGVDGMQMNNGMTMNNGMGMPMTVGVPIGMNIAQAQMMQQQQMARNMMPLASLNNPMGGVAGAPGTYYAQGGLPQQVGLQQQMGIQQGQLSQAAPMNLNANINHLLQQPIPSNAMPAMPGMPGGLPQMNPGMMMGNTKIPAISSLLAANGTPVANMNVNNGNGTPAPAVVAPAVANSTGTDEGNSKQSGQ